MDPRLANSRTQNTYLEVWSGRVGQVNLGRRQLVGGASDLPPGSFNWFVIRTKERKEKPRQPALSLLYIAQCMPCHVSCEFMEMLSKIIEYRAGRGCDRSSKVVVLKMGFKYFWFWKGGEALLPLFSVSPGKYNALDILYWANIRL